MKKIIIYLANLMHPNTYREIAVPLGIASIASYLKKKLGGQVEIKIFIDCEELVETIRETSPDIIGLSNYMWNQNLTYKALEYYSEISPHTLNIIGGPNVTRMTNNYKNILLKYPFIDIIVLDQGEVAFFHIVERYIEFKNKEKVLSKEIPGCAMRINNSDNICRGKIIHSKSVDLNEFPSPYLGGDLDKFLSMGCLPSIETTRGCPYTCACCTQADKYYKHLSRKDESMVYKELEYIKFKAVRREIIITDNNFGILGERDVRIANFILDMHEKTGFPEIYSYGSSKVKTSHSIEVMKIMAKMTGTFTFGIQTLSEKVLNISVRKNIKYHDYIKLANYAVKKNIRLTADMIFGLPEETLDSFYESISKVVQLGIHAPQTRTLKMIPGSPISDLQREKYKYTTRFRPISNAFGEYRLCKDHTVRVIETEEICYFNSSTTEKDYFEIRQYIFLVELLLSYGGLSDTFQFFISRKINISNIFRYILNNANKMNSLQKILTLHMEYAQKELFVSDQELFETLSKNDQLWDSLMHSKGVFIKVNLGFTGYCLLHDSSPLYDIEKIVIEYATDNLPEKDIENLKYCINFDRKCRLVYVNKNENDVPLTIDEIEKEKVYTVYYDYLKWKKSGFKNDIDQYLKNEAIKLKFIVKNFHKIKNAIDNNCNYRYLHFYERIILEVQQNIRRIVTRI